MVYTTCIILLFVGFLQISGRIICNKTKPAKLKYDEAMFQIHSKNSTTLTLEGISGGCYHCKQQVYAYGTSSIAVKVNTDYVFHYTIKNVTGKICHGSYHFKEHGHYKVMVGDDENGDQACNEVEVLKKPDFVYLPLVVMFSILLFLIIIYNMCNILWRRHLSKRQIGYTRISGGESDNLVSDLDSSSKYGSVTNNYIAPSHPVNSRPATRTRLKSLDTFRGISIIIMVFVNYTGGRYWFFNHSAWNGLTVADLVFPWFIFIMGTSIFISFRSMRRKRVSKKAIAWKISFRTLKLLALGLFLNNGSNLTHWRLPGVLQRFALSYFAVAMVNLIFTPDEDEIDTHYNYDWRDAFRDLTWFRMQHIVMLLILLVYLLLTFLLPVPGCPKGYLGPGGIGDYGKYKNCTGGAAKYIDMKVFGLNHIYQGPTCQDYYKCHAHDPEGLLGVLPSILLTYLGLMASRILFLYSKQSSHIKRWLIWAVVWGAIACGLCGASQNNGVIPVNKNLWSLSFILVTGSMAFFLLTICYILVDVKHWWSGAPFYFSGMNAILLYVGHELLRDYFPFDFHNNSQHSELLTRAAVGAGVWLVVSYMCFRSNIFWKL
ncbi:heparan-alpha-glucosaminide N-acetyltransferase-like isoform X2 [Hydractinia symbiolongicarpus]|uniref:heparan-alpha-glucosaminide N-acetyltransferase-like isoform X2 n=1 Tax=Hydractinia symbiolongicarpus TaxID=13093 RepID=UPI00254BCC29|nr:heparan-alpha-glucosaminide N-acetyltransferase-like isoform X2 [Hydractinia symbiolongicarpus]